MVRYSLSWWTIAVCIALTAITLAVLLICPTVGIHWKKDSMDAFLKTMGALGLVAIFVERVVEVFVAIWQDPSMDKIIQQIEFQQSIQVDRRRQIAALSQKLTATPPPNTATKALLSEKIAQKETELELAETNAERLEGELVPYRATTRRLASWISMVIGVLTAGVGFRILNNLVEVDPVALASNHYQYNWFVVIDVLLTGAVLAGGSKAVHQVFKVYDSLMDSSQSLLQKRKLQDPPPVPPAGTAP